MTLEEEIKKEMTKRLLADFLELQIHQKNDLYTYQEAGKGRPDGVFILTEKPFYFTDLKQCYIGYSSRGDYTFIHECEVEFKHVTPIQEEDAWRIVQGIMQ